MRSFETLIGNHVGLNFKKRTLRYLFVKVSSTHEHTYLPYSTGIKRELCEQMYITITIQQEMSYPETYVVVQDAQRTYIANIIRECRERLQGLHMIEEDCYVNSHLYLPRLHHIHMQMEENISIQESLAQTKASKGFVHLKLHSLVNFNRPQNTNHYQSSKC
ncbi:unnamed protein product [Rhizopus stolonifer]